MPVPPWPRVRQSSAQPSSRARQTARERQSDVVAHSRLGRVDARACLPSRRLEASLRVAPTVSRWQLAYGNGSVGRPSCAGSARTGSVCSRTALAVAWQANGPDGRRRDSIGRSRSAAMRAEVCRSFSPALPLGFASGGLGLAAGLVCCRADGASAFRSCSIFVSASTVQSNVSCLGRG